MKKKIDSHQIDIKKLQMTLNSLLEEVESVKGYFDFGKIFSFQGETLREVDIFSVITFYSKKSKKVTVKSFTCCPDKKNNSKAIIEKKIPLAQISRYTGILKKKTPLFCPDSLGHLATIWPEINQIIPKGKKMNSIILPLVNRGDVLGFMELYSQSIDKKHIPLFRAFAKRFVLRISNILLFQQIKQSEKKYRELFEKGQEGFLILNVEKKKILDANNKFCRLTGFSRAEVLKMSFLKLLPKNEIEKIKNYIKDLQSQVDENNLHIKKLAITLVTKNNKRKYLHIRVIRFISKNEWFLMIRDVTERVKAEEALRESEEKYRNLVDNATEAVVVLEKDGSIIFANNAFFHNYGFKKNQIKESHFSRLTHPDDYNLVVGEMNKVFSGEEKTLQVDFRILDKNDKIRHVVCRGTILQERGKTTGIQAIFHDVTKERELFTSIEKAKRHFENIIDTIQDGICVINRNFQIESCNLHFADKVGLSFSKIKGKNCSGILPRYEKGLFKGHCSKTVCNKTCGVEEVFRGLGEVSFIEENSDQYGKMRYHQVNVYPSTNKQGEIQKAVMTIRDVTEKLSADEELRRLNEFNQRILNNAPVSIMIIDKKGDISATNDYVEKITNKKDYIGKNIFKTPFFKEQKLEDKYLKLLESGESFSKDNCMTINSSGEVKYLNIIAVPLKNEKNKIEGAISMALDNTEAVLAKRRIEKMNKDLGKTVSERTWQLNKLNKELARVLELKSKFISDASHELRTPLTIIQGNLDLAISEYKSRGKKAPELFLMIEKEVGHISNLLSDLSMITHADTNSENIAYQNVDIIDLVNDVASSLNILAKKKTIKIKLEKYVKKQIMIKGDEEKLERLFINIINNAIKYSDKKGEIKIWFEVNSLGVSIVIKDTGVGIPSEDLPYIFERFYRVDKARSRKECGTGLGLAICDIVAKAHRGNINVESQVGVGTKFSVNLPFDYKKGPEERNLQLKF